MKVSHAVLRLVAALFILGAPVAGLADKESPRLAKYRDQLDNSVVRALKWLATHQNRDGSFPGGYGQTTAIVGLAAMAFLSKGYTPDSEPYGDVINKCIDYVLRYQRANGCLDAAPGGGAMYAHGIATLLLSEVSGMVDSERQEKIDKVLSKALKVILDAQAIPKDGRNKGGWRYAPNSRDSDISVTGWQVLALRSARQNGAQIPKQAIEDAAAYIMKCRMPDGGFAYQPGNGSGVARAGVGILCLELTGHHDTPETRGGGDYLLRSMGKDGFIRDGQYHYALYYCAQGMFQLGGEYWEVFAERMYRTTLKQQKADGSWGGGPGEAYSTAATVLALTVSYRQLPIYQR